MFGSKTLQIVKKMQMKRRIFTTSAINLYFLITNNEREREIERILCAWK